MPTILGVAVGIAFLLWQVSFAIAVSHETFEFDGKEVPFRNYEQKALYDTKSN